MIERTSANARNVARAARKTPPRRLRGWRGGSDPSEPRPSTVLAAVRRATAFRAATHQAHLLPSLRRIDARRYVDTTHRPPSICRRETHPDDRRNMLPAGPLGAAGGGRIRAAGFRAPGARRSGPAAAPEHHQCSSGRRGVRVRSHEAARLVTTNREPPSEGAHRGGPSRARAARTLGLLQRPPRADRAPAWGAGGVILSR